MGEKIEINRRVLASVGLSKYCSLVLSKFTKENGGSYYALAKRVIVADEYGDLQTRHDKAIKVSNLRQLRQIAEMLLLAIKEEENLESLEANKNEKMQ